MTDVARVRASLHKAFAKLGYANAHACPESKKNYEGILHELYVSHEGKSYFEKRHNVAKDAVVELVGQDVVDKVAEGTTQSVLEGDAYSLAIKKNAAAMRIDKAKIGVELRKEGWDQKKVDKFMSKISVSSKPATSIMAVPKLT